MWGLTASIGPLDGKATVDEREIPFHTYVITGDEELEDVINVPPQATVRIAWYPDDRPGSWMYHCHILEHHAAGMMAHFDVVR